MLLDSLYAREEEFEKHWSIARYKSIDDFWRIIGKKVYDVIYFLKDHSVNKNSIMLLTGKDSTEEFDLSKDIYIVSRIVFSTSVHTAWASKEASSNHGSNDEPFYARPISPSTTTSVSMMTAASTRQVTSSSIRAIPRRFTFYSNTFFYFVVSIYFVIFSISITQVTTSTSTTTEDSSKDKNDYDDKIFWYDVDSIIFYFDMIFYNIVRELQPRLLYDRRALLYAGEAVTPHTKF